MVSDGWVASTLSRECVAKDAPLSGDGELVSVPFAIDDSARRAEDARLQLELADGGSCPPSFGSLQRALLDHERLSQRSSVAPARMRLTENDIERAVVGAFSFSTVLFSNEVSRQGVARGPRDRILLESDGPRLLPPHGYGNKRGEPIRKMAAVQALGEGGYILAEPAALLRTATEIAELRRVAMDEFFRQLAVNEKRFLANWPRVSVDA